MYLGTQAPVRITRACLSLIGLLLAFSCHGQQQTTDPTLTINGLIVDETVTKVGRDFYELFYSRWQAPASKQVYMIFVREQPQPGMGSRVSVYLNDTELFVQPLQPRYDIIEAYAEYAVRLVRQYVLEYQRMVQELENEDQSGSGIF